jgi:hypothetical protein
LNGEERFRVDSQTKEVICIDYGTSTDALGDIYNWVISCSRITKGGKEQENRDIGEYDCIAYRSGPNMKDTGVSAFIPCQFIQLGECGCAPLDVYPFGLDPPTHACRTQADCPFLCSDVPESDPLLLCQAFGGVEWWEGQNFLGIEVFHNITERVPDATQENNVEIEIFA